LSIFIGCHEDSESARQIGILHGAALRIMCFGELAALFYESDFDARDRSVRETVEQAVSRYFYPIKRRFRQPKTVARAFEDFCGASLSWVEGYSNTRQDEANRARLFCEEIMTSISRNCLEGHGRFKPLFDYVEQRYSNQRSTREDRFRTIHDEFDGLVLYLAARFKGSLDWLEESEIGRSALLVSSIYEALRSSVTALVKCAEQLSCLDLQSELRALVVANQLSGYGLRIKERNLGDLKACLIRTPFGSTVYLNAGLFSEERELACFHELGHFVLHHQQSSEYALDPELLTSAGLKDQFVRQERAADGFAELWSHVLQGLIDYVLAPLQDISKSGPQTATESTRLRIDEVAAAEDTTQPEISCI
jgi:hypothetical protein